MTAQIDKNKLLNFFSIQKSLVEHASDLSTTEKGAIIGAYLALQRMINEGDFDFKEQNDKAD